MVGFVGSRARKRRRNFLLALSILIFFSIFYFLYSTLEINNYNIIPNENIIPNPDEGINSLVSNIEDLELELFNKEQKIKFRDGQIKNLKSELKNITSQFEDITLELNDLKREYTILSSDNENLVSPIKYKSLQDNLSKLNNKNNNNISTIKNLNKKIEELNNNFLLIEGQTNDIIRENQKLKKDNKSFFANNIKLDNIINEQKIEIDLQLKQIKELKDTTHHGG